MRSITIHSATTTCLVLLANVGSTDGFLVSVVERPRTRTRTTSPKSVALYQSESSSSDNGLKKVISAVFDDNDYCIKKGEPLVTKLGPGDTFFDGPNKGMSSTSEKPSIMYKRESISSSSSAAAAPLTLTSGSGTIISSAKAGVAPEERSEPLVTQIGPTDAFLLGPKQASSRSTSVPVPEKLVSSNSPEPEKVFINRLSDDLKMRFRGIQEPQSKVPTETKPVQTTFTSTFTSTNSEQETPVASDIPEADNNFLIDRLSDGLRTRSRIFQDDVKMRSRIFQEAQAEGCGFKLSMACAMAGEYDEDDIHQEINDLIHHNPCVMFTWESSPSCKEAVKALDVAGAKVKIVRLDDPWSEGNPIRAEIGKTVGRSSVPMIYIGGEYVGGYDGGVSDEAPGILRLALEGKLRTKLQEVGALKEQ